MKREDVVATLVEAQERAERNASWCPEGPMRADRERFVAAFKAAVEALTREPAPATDDDEWGPPIIPGGERVNPLEPDLPDRVIAAAGGTANACHFLGWQGGTVHQVREEINRRIKERGERCASSEPAPAVCDECADCGCPSAKHTVGGPGGLCEDRPKCSCLGWCSKEPKRAPAPCPHRELLQSCSVILNQFAPREKVNDPWGRQSDARVETLRDRVDAALAQPCAAPGEAGDGWELVGDHAVENLTALASMGACWQPGDRVIVYRRRAPEPHPAPQPSSELPDPCATCGHDAMGHEGPWLREPPHRGQCWEKGCPCTVYRRAPEREGGDPDVR